MFTDSRTRLFYAFFGLGLAFALLSAGCLDQLNGEECSRDRDCPSGELCYEAACQPSCDENDSCEFLDEVCVQRTSAPGAVCLVDDSGEPADAGTDTTGDTGTPEDATDTTEDTAVDAEQDAGQEDVDAGAPSMQYVLIEDLSSNTQGDNPGADIDAIALSKNGVEYPATSIEDYNIAMGSVSVDPNQALGAPDSACEAQNFVALGGSGGYLVVSFDTVEEDIEIESGDEIIVYELGATVCPNRPSWMDDPVSVGISSSTDVSTFTDIGTVGNGVNVVQVP
jgi:hypothetical protein